MLYQLSYSRMIESYGTDVRASCSRALGAQVLTANRFARQAEQSFSVRTTRPERRRQLPAGGPNSVLTLKESASPRRPSVDSCSRGASRAAFNLTSRRCPSVDR